MPQIDFQPHSGSVNPDHRCLTREAPRKIGTEEPRTGSMSTLTLLPLVKMPADDDEAQRGVRGRRRIAKEEGLRLRERRRRAVCREIQRRLQRVVRGTDRPSKVHRELPARQRVSSRANRGGRF